MTFHKARDDDEMANLIWNDSAVQHEKIAELRNYQVLWFSFQVKEWKRKKNVKNKDVAKVSSYFPCI